MHGSMDRWRQRRGGGGANNEDKEDDDDDDNKTGREDIGWGWGGEVQEDERRTV